MNQHRKRLHGPTDAKPDAMERRRFVAASGSLLIAAAAAGGSSRAAAEESTAWPSIRKNLFGDRVLLPGDASQLSLQLPVRAADAAVVPLSAWTADTPLGRAVRRLHLVIDENPSPVLGTFEFAAGNEPVGLETRVRIEAYSFVRAIAETADGKLYEHAQFVKASGGCSAPAGKDAAAAAAALGRMRLRGPETYTAGVPVVMQVMLQHPNNSGLVMDQLTRLFEAPHYVHHVTVTFEGTPVWSAAVNFSISENPNFRFRFTPRAPGRLVARMEDTQGRKFETELPIALQGGAAAG